MATVVIVGSASGGPVTSGIFVGGKSVHVRVGPGMLVCIDSAGSVDAVGTDGGMGGMLVCIDNRVSVLSPVKAETTSEIAIVVITGSVLVGDGGGMLVCMDSGGSVSDPVKGEVDSEDAFVGIEAGVASKPSTSEMVYHTSLTSTIVFDDGVTSGAVEVTAELMSEPTEGTKRWEPGTGAGAAKTLVAHDQRISMTMNSMLSILSVGVGGVGVGDVVVLFA